MEESRVPRIVNCELTDPFSWLELPGVETSAWSMRMAAQAGRFFNSLPGEQSRVADKIRLALSYDARTVPLGRNGRYLYLRLPAKAERASLWLACNPAEDGYEVLHPVLLDRDDGMAEIGQICPSPNGGHAVLAVTHGGRQSTELVVIDIREGHPASVVERLPSTSLAWAAWADENSFFWSRREMDEQVFSIHGVGGADRRIYLPFTATGIVPIVSEDGLWLILLTYSHGVPGCRLHAAANSPNPRFAEITGPNTEGLRIAGWLGDGLALVTPSVGGSEIVVAHLAPLAEGRAPVLQSLHRDKTGMLAGACSLPNGDMLLIDRSRDGGNAFRHLAQDGSISPVFSGIGHSLGEWTVDRQTGLLLADVQRWDTTSQLHCYNAHTRSFQALRPAEARLRLSTACVEVEARDGALVPVTLLKPEGREGPMPCLLWGYGGFGISLQPSCMMNLEPWFAAGGMVAIAHVRGGGERGPSWHDAGRGPNKIKSFEDFVAVARWLEANAHSTRRHLCLWGASAGGLLALGSAVLAPDCCAAVIAENPVTDMAKFTRFEDDGRYWTVEFGDTENDPEALANAAHWSPLHNLKLGRQYPATLISISLNDERVSPIHGRKMTAALLETGSAGPHLLLEQDGAGHCGAATVSDYSENRAELLRFAAWAAGLVLN